MHFFIANYSKCIMKHIFKELKTKELREVFEA